MLRFLLALSIAHLLGSPLASAEISPLAEAHANLKAARTAERAYYQEKDRYSQLLAELGFSPGRGNRYAYCFAASGPGLRRNTTRPGDHDAASKAVMVGPDEVTFPKAKFLASARDTGCPASGFNGDEKLGVGVHGTGPQQEFVILAAGNLDDDSKLDCWTITSFSRLVGSTPVPAGEPYHEQADLLPEAERALAEVQLKDEREKAKTEAVRDMRGAGVVDALAQRAYAELLDGAFAMPRFHKERGGEPSTWAGLAAFARLPVSDPWGRPYLLMPVRAGSFAPGGRGDRMEGGLIFLPRPALLGASCGADGTPGTVDDVTLGFFPQED